MELLKCVYFCTQKSIIEVGNNKFQDLINVLRIVILLCIIGSIITNNIILQVQKMLHDAAECDARRIGNGFMNKLLQMNVL